MSEDSEAPKDDLVFESGSEKDKRNPPLFENEDHGVTAWIDEDRNGNYFLRLRLPLGLGTVPVFVNDSSFPSSQKNFNELVDHLLDQRNSEE